MSKFKYKARKSDGSEYEGVMEAVDRTAVYHELKKNGDMVIFAALEKSGKMNSDLSRFLPFLGKVKMHDKIIFAQNLGAMIDAGLALSRALAVQERQTKNKKLKEVIGELNESIKSGKSLNESMKARPDVFSDLFVSMVRAGEESGNLSESLRNLANQMDKTYSLQKKVKGALIYPAVILTAMVLIGILMMIYVVPTLTKTFKEMKVDLPFSTQVIVKTSDFLANHTIIFVLLLALFVWGMVYFFKTAIGKKVVGYFSMHTPVISTIVKETNTARTARTLSSLLSAGVDVVVALEVTQEVIQNGEYRVIIKKAQEAIQKGSPISKIFAENEKLYPPFMGEMISVGEETGRLAEMLGSVATYYETEVDQKTKDMSTIIEPVLMIVIGIAVGFFAISIMSPIYSVMDSV